MASFCTDLLFVSMILSSVLTEEPKCTQYTVQDKLVDVVFELQHQVNTLKRELRNVQHQLNNYQLFRDMATATLETHLTAEDKRIEEKLTTLTKGLPSRTTSDMTGLWTPGGSVYTRWGRSTCNANRTKTVYSGYAAGSNYENQGAAANHLCLTKDPLWNRFDDTKQSGALVYGAEYEFDYRSRINFFDREITDQDAPCAVCESPRSQLLMIPGRNKCLDGWTLEYEGYLVAGDISHVAASEFICLDANPEALPNDTGNTNGKVFYFAEARCGGSLKCPPYVDGRELTCVVCTK